MLLSSLPRRKISSLLILVIAVFLSYAFILNNGFLGDDYTRIVINPELDSLSAALRGILGDRPVLMLSVWLDRKIFGLNVLGFRAMSALFHVFVAWQFFLFLKEITRSKEGAGENTCLIIALIFSLHPLHNQAISIIIQRGVILASLFAVISMRHFYKYVLEAKTKDLLFSLLFFSLGLLSKPILSFIPLFYFVWMRSLGSRNKKILFIYFIALLIPFYFYFVEKRNVQSQAFSPLTYFQVQTEVVLFYFGKILAPVNLSYLYDFYPPKDSVFNLSWLYLTVLILVVFGLNKLTKNKFAWIFFVGFLLSFIPETSFFPIRHLAFDHRVYLPLVFLFSFIGVLAVEHEIWKYKWYRPTIMLFIFGYFILNQARNFEIKPVSNWMLNTLENSVSDHSNNFSMTAKLIDERKIHELTPIIEKYKILFTDFPIYQILINAHAFFAHPEMRKNVLEKLIALTQEPINEIYPRVWLNSFLINRFNRGSTLNEKLVIEQFLAYQMNVFNLPQNKKSFESLAVFYYQTANEILNDPEARKMLSKEHLLRIRGILVYYFNRPDKELSKEISLELTKNPDSGVLQRLKEMIP